MSEIFKNPFREEATELGEPVEFIRETSPEDAEVYLKMILSSFMS